jgi:hypothetical protein
VNADPQAVTLGDALQVFVSVQEEDQLHAWTKIKEDLV